MENTYWNQAGKFQAQFYELSEKMTPSGPQPTVGMEMIRAACRLSYDFYNNGMGNNTSGAVNFLNEKSVLDDETYDNIYEFTRGQIYRGGYNGDRVQVSIEKMIDMVCSMIINNPQLLTIENTEDMFDYEDPEQEFCFSCDDLLDDNEEFGECYSCRHDESIWEEEEDYA